MGCYCHPAGKICFEGGLIGVAGLGGGEFAGYFGHDVAVWRGVAGGVVETGGLDEEHFGAVFEEALEAGCPCCVGICLCKVSKSGD